MKVRIACAALLAVLAAPLSFGLSLTAVNVNAGIVVVFTTDPQAAPSPIKATIGASLPIGITDLIFIEPCIDLFGVNYRYTDVRAVPATIEAADGFFTACILIGAQAGVRYPLTKELEIGGGAGVDFLIRFPLELENTGAESVADRNLALPYFYGNARFLYPETRIYLRWQLVEQMGLVFSVRALYPLFHLWDGESLPFLDQFMMAGSLGFSIPL